MNFKQYKNKLRGLRREANIKLSDYNGWTNWDTWHTGLMMDNEEPTYNHSRKLVQQGGTPDHLRDWATQHVIGPHNKRQIADAKEWNAIPLEERQRQQRQHDIDQYGEAAVNMGNSLMQPFNDMQNEGKDEDEIRREQEYDAPDLMDPEMVNWDELHQHIQEENEENARYEQEQAGQQPAPRPAPPNPDQAGDTYMPQDWQ